MYMFNIFIIFRKNTDFEMVKSNYLRLFGHPALSSASSEMEYLRSVVLIFLKALLPKDYNLLGTSAYLVRELIAQNVLLTVVNMASNPSWLFSMVIKILGDEDETYKDVNSNLPIQYENPQLDNQEIVSDAANSVSDAKVKRANFKKVAEDVQTEILYERPPAIGQDSDKIVAEVNNMLASMDFSIDHFSHADEEKTEIDLHSTDPISRTSSGGSVHIVNDYDQSIYVPRYIMVKMFYLYINNIILMFRRRATSGILFYHVRIPETLIMSEPFNKNSKYTLYRISYYVASNKHPLELEQSSEADPVFYV